MFAKIFTLLMCLFLVGCSTSLKPLKFRGGTAVYSGKEESEPLITYTNVLQIVKPSQTNKVSVKIPVVLSQPKNNTNLENVTVTIPKRIELTVVVPESTNNVVISAVKEKSLFSPSVLFLYYLFVIVAVLVGWYIWNKSKAKTIIHKTKIDDKINEIIVPPSLTPEK